MTSTPIAAGLDRILTTPIEARNWPRSPITISEIREAGWHLEDLWLPSAVLYEEALTHNIARFAAWCRERGMAHAPHGKTPMAPQLWHRQLAAGAWGITAASAAQARSMIEHGVTRILLANEVIQPVQARWLADAHAAYPDLLCLSLVDSSAGVAVLEEASAQAGTQLPVLVELGVAGRRTGVRSVAEALELAEEVHRSPHLRLQGLEGYEGVLPQKRDERSVADASAWLEAFGEVARRLDEAGLFEGLDEVVLTIGGSGFPDLAADALAGVVAQGLSVPVLPIIRAGAYVTHDHRYYDGNSPLRSTADADPLTPAMPLFAQVSSTPEPGRALLNAGKREMPIDIDLPFVLRARRADGTWYEPEGVRITELADHHAFVEDLDSVLEIGELVEVGMSHPCTVFDKWRLIPVVDGDLRVVDAVATLF
ncbi:MAG: alanine racemase [Brachybacterium sp.]|nr:alanine racemase [Brachybacterium sp.]